MILLSGHSLTHSRKVPLEALSLQLKERDSTATMTPADMTGIGVNSWLRDDTNPGAGIVWRVKSISQAFATDTPTVTLEHVINTLRDNILFGEITPATITGNPKATSCTAEQAVRFILARSADWVLGNFGYNVSNPYKFDGDTLFDALETVTESLNNACWTYDTTVYPFRLNIVQKDSSVDSELRAGRNLSAITQTIDKSGMYTRFYPTGKDDLHLDGGGYVEMNANIYGIIDHVESDSSIDTKAELQRWATERLKNHCEPTVTIDVEGFELADATGESLDRLTLGRACRIPLPEYGTTIQERIVALSYPDKVHQPKVFKATLANNRQDVTKIISDAIKNGSGGKSGRTYGKQSKDDHAWIEDTEDHVALCAESIIGRDPNGVDWKRFSTIIVDGNGIHQRVEKNAGDIVTAFTQIDANENRITLEAQRAMGAEGELSGRIIVQADRITQEVTRASAAEGELKGRIIVQADRITQEVTDRRSGDSVLQGKIDVQANRITAEVTNRQNGDLALSGRIDVQADRITAEVTRAVTEERALMGALEVEADRAGVAVGFKDTRPIRYIYQTSYLPRPGDPNVIYYCQDVKKYYEWVSSTNSYSETTPGKYIKAGEIVTSINEAGESEAHINSDKVYIGSDKSTTVINGKCKLSDVTADVIKDRIALIATVTAQTIQAGTLKITPVEGMGYVNVDTAYNGSSLTLSGNTYTLRLAKMNGSYNEYTFSRATALTDAWSSGTLTVTASPQGETLIRTLVEGTKENEDGTAYTTGGIYYVPIKSQWTSGGSTYSEATGKRVKFDASTEYNNGYNNGTTDGKNAVTLNDPTWNTKTGDIDANRTVTVSTSGRPTQLSKDVALSLSQSGNTVYLKHGDTNVAKIDVSGGTHSITITPDATGKTDEPSGTRLWSTTVFQKNKWYKMTVKCGTASKDYKILINCT